MAWLWSWFSPREPRPHADQEADRDTFRRREAELKERLERLTVDVDVIQRTETAEEPRE